MSNWIAARDISQYQGTFTDTGEPIVMVKMSGGDAGLYYDTQATNNYYAAKALGKSVGGYHFAGGTDPVKEADYFVGAMSPLAENDVMALDWEVQNPNPVGWCLSFVNEVHAKTGVWPLLYINASTCNAYDWSPVLANCGLWIADYAVSPDANVPISHPYVMHQYTDSPYDQDAWFGTIAEFQAYGYHAPIPATTVPLPPPPSPPAPAPAPVAPPEPQPSPQPSPSLNTKTAPPQATDVVGPSSTTPSTPPQGAKSLSQKKTGLWNQILNLIDGLLKFLHLRK